ncbi:MAG: hypothetical protein V4584_19060 [Verrucomicrobiota bacterium]
MSDPPGDRAEFWIRFVCAFLFFGVLAAAAIMQFADSMGIAQGAAVWAVIVISISVYAARVGDEAWHKLIGAIRWW